MDEFVQRKLASDAALCPLEAHKSLVDLIEVVEAEYSVEHEQAERDATQFLNDMFAVGLVEVCSNVPMPAIESSTLELSAGAD